MAIADDFSFGTEEYEITVPVGDPAYSAMDLYGFLVGWEKRHCDTCDRETTHSDYCHGHQYKCADCREFKNDTDGRWVIAGDWVCPPCAQIDFRKKVAEGEDPFERMEHDPKEGTRHKFPQICLEIGCCTLDRETMTVVWNKDME